MRSRTLIASSLFYVVMALASLVALSQPGLAQGRVALVIGNSAYRNVPALPNPSADAADVAASLERLGFSVTQLKDASFDDLRHALIGFGDKARGADMAMIYFAGHGMEVAGENWVIPVDAELRTDIDTENEAVGLKSLMLAVSGARDIGLVILDACRNDPFDVTMKRSGRTRSVTRGLAPIEPNDNVLVAFSAKDGTTATDGEGRHSPFTAALLQHMETPGLEINFLFRNVRDDVLAATDRRQQPFVYGSLSREAVYLKPPEQSPTTVQPLDAPGVEDIAWTFLRDSTDPTSLRRFVAQFPASGHGAEANERIASLDAKALSAATTPSSAVIGVNPMGSAAAPEPELALAKPEQAAVARMFHDNTPAVESAWSLVKTSADPAVLRRFVDEFPDDQRRTVVKALGGAPGTGPVLKQLRGEQMHAVLSDYGTFVRHPRYGEVWSPTVTPKGWHPYEPCHWVNSRRLGWYYFDQTPWGAIVHHYGRWTHDPAMGWIWVPGTDFSPGWVVWRTNPQKIGWAPTPPDEDVKTLTAEDFDQSDFWTFMDVGTFAHGCAATAAAPALSVKTLIRETTYVHDLKTVGGIAVAVLPSYVIGDPVDFDIAFDPWPTGFVGQILSDWNGVWNASSVAMLCPPSGLLPVVPLPPKVIRVLPPKAATITPPKVVVAPPAAPAKVKPITRSKDPMSGDPMNEPPPEFYDPPPRFRPQGRPVYGQDPSGFQDPPPRFRPQRPPYYRQYPSGFQDSPPRFHPQRPPYYGQESSDYQDQQPREPNFPRRRWPIYGNGSGFGGGPSRGASSPEGGTSVGVGGASSPGGYGNGNGTGNGGGKRR